MDPTGDYFYIFLNAEQMSKDMEKNTKLPLVRLSTWATTDLLSGVVSAFKPDTYQESSFSTSFT